MSRFTETTPSLFVYASAVDDAPFDRPFISAVGRVGDTLRRVVPGLFCLPSQGLSDVYLPQTAVNKLLFTNWSPMQKDTALQE